MKLSRVRFFSSLITVTLIVSGFSININAINPSNKDSKITVLSDKSKESSKKITTVQSIVVNDKDLEQAKKFIEQENLKKENVNEEKLKFEETDVNIYNSSNVDKLTSNDAYIIVDGELLNNDKVKNKIRELYNSGSKIAIKKVNITQNDVSDILGIDKNIVPVIPDDDMPSVELKRVGAVVKKVSDNQVNLRAVNVQEYNNPQEVDNAFVFTLKSKKLDKEIDKALGKNSDDEQSKSLISFRNAKSYAAEYTSNWISVQVQGATDYYTEGSVERSIVLKRDSNNPKGM